MSHQDQGDHDASSTSGNNNGRELEGSKSPVLQCEIIQALEDTWTANIFVVSFSVITLWELQDIESK